MLNFDEQRFLAIQAGAVSQGESVGHIIRKCLRDGAENIYFLGAGGAAILMQPAVQLLRNRSTFPVFCELPAELVIAGSPSLSSRSIAVIPSLSGATKESVAMLQKLKEVGATVIALVGHADTPLGKEADYPVVNFAADDTSSESFYIQSLLIALAILDQRGEIGNYDDIVKQLRNLPGVLLSAKQQYESKAEDFAKIIAGSDYHIVTASGNAWPEAFYYAMCILEEMQWIRTRPVHASDFFHGTLELVDKDVSVILFKGEDDLRPLAERVEGFAPRYTEKFAMLDTAELRADGISQEVRKLLSPILLATMLERISAHLEVMRDHPLTTRRYYKRVAY